MSGSPVLQLLLPRYATRRWHQILIERLESDGYRVDVGLIDTSWYRHFVFDQLLRLERRLPGVAESERLAAAVELELLDDRGPWEEPYTAVINLSGERTKPLPDTPEIELHFDGDATLNCAAIRFCLGVVPDIELMLDGTSIQRISPMADSRVSIHKGMSDVLARAITVLCAYLAQAERRSEWHSLSFSDRTPSNFAAQNVVLLCAYVCLAIPRLARRFFNQRRYYQGHWHVGYRFVDGPGTVETVSMAGEPWQTVADDGRRFYADPFPYRHGDDHFIFVEEVGHPNGKGVVSVAQLNTDGSVGEFRTVLEEPYHLSYPQVFEMGGEIWMIPESGAGHRVALYRSTRFPDDWELHAVLIEGRDVFDATFFVWDGLFWLIGSERDGYGSASDTMVLFYAESLQGPWTAHPMNPLLIDKTAARPGGQVKVEENRIQLVVQDGTEHYGGGASLLTISFLDKHTVQFESRRKIEPPDDTTFARVHTVNRSNQLEVIDGFSERVPRR